MSCQVGSIGKLIYYDNYYIVVDPLFQGPLLYGLCNFSIVLASIIYDLELAIIFAYMCPINGDEDPISYNLEYIYQNLSKVMLVLQQFILTTQIALRTSFKKNNIFYCIFQLLHFQNSLRYIIIFGGKSKFQLGYFYASNIYFSLMILITTGSLILVYQKYQGIYDDFYNYMTLIY